MVDNSKWAQCLQIIKGKIGEGPFTTWFSDVVCLGVTDNELHLKVPSSFFAEYIDANFIDEMLSAIKTTYGRWLDIVYKFNIAADQDMTVMGNKSEPVKTPKIPDIDPQLNPGYTFRNYCRSESNKIAVSVAEAIAQHPERNQFNPLFIFGPTGVGKTHLIQAIGVGIKDKQPENRVLYVTARMFMSQYTTAHIQGETNKFFNFYQSVHTLIVDDVQDFNGKASTQNTFYHIFNHLYLNNRRIILSSDRSPAEMEGFEERLLGRFKCGMSVALEKPDAELRRMVLTLKARREGIELEPDIVDYIVNNVTESIRDLEGVMMSLITHATVLNKPVSLELTKFVVQNAIKINRPKINFEIIVREVSSYYDINQDYLFTKSRKREISDARQIVMYLAKKHLDLAHTAIGRRLGRSHATVLHGINTIEERLDFDKTLRNDIEQIEAGMKY